MKQYIFTLALIAVILTGCDPAGLGYVNRLSQPITIVENRSMHPPLKIPLASGEISQRTIRTVPRSIDIFDSHDRLVAHYRIRDIARDDQSGYYLVLSPQGAYFRLLPSEN